MSARGNRFGFFGLAVGGLVQPHGLSLRLRAIEPSIDRLETQRSHLLAWPPHAMTGAIEIIAAGNRR
jgi:hypothetical protein